jgi:hypothetical protein
MLLSIKKISACKSEQVRMQLRNLENKQFNVGSPSLVVLFSAGSLIRIYLKEAGSVI